MQELHAHCREIAFLDNGFGDHRFYSREVKNGGR